MAYSGKTNWKLDDTVMPTDMNRIEQGIIDNETSVNTKATATNYTATIPTSGWSSSAPYTIDITVTGMINTDSNFPVSPIYSDTADTRKAQAEAWGKISMIKSGTDKITVTCDEELPTTAIPIQIMVVR